MFSLSDLLVTFLTCRRTRRGTGAGGMTEFAEVDLPGNLVFLAVEDDGDVMVGVDPVNYRLLLAREGLAEVCRLVSRLIVQAQTGPGRRVELRAVS